MIGAVNPDDREAEADPVFAERIVGPRFDFVLDVLARLQVGEVRVELALLLL